MSKRRRENEERKIDAEKVRRLVGRTIVSADPCASWEGEGVSREWMHDWNLTLDDGSVVWFVVEEHPDGAEYGADLGVSPAKKGKVK